MRITIKVEDNDGEVLAKEEYEKLDNQILEKLFHEVEMKLKRKKAVEEIDRAILTNEL